MAHNRSIHFLHLLSSGALLMLSKIKSFIQSIPIRPQWVAWFIMLVAGYLTAIVMGTKPEIPPLPDVPLLPQIEKEAQKNAIEAKKAFAPEELADEEFFICGRTESVVDANIENFTAKPWPVKKLTWHVKLNGFTGLKEPEVLEAFRVAWASWAKVIDIEPIYTNRESEAMILSQFGDIDGSGKVLAWSELSNGTVTQKHQLYDRRERWEISQNPQNIDLIRVAAHEIGHVLGLVHDERGANALMAPAYSKRIQFPTELDTRRIIALGYNPAKKDQPIDPKSTEPLPGIVLTIPPETLIEALKKAGYIVEKK